VLLCPLQISHKVLGMDQSPHDEQPAIDTVNQQACCHLRCLHKCILKFENKRINLSQKIHLFTVKLPVLVSKRKIFLLSLGKD
jgi:hypothetical protein